MRRVFTVVALAGLATIARAQNPGVSVVPFDQKKGGSEKMHMLGHAVSHEGAWNSTPPCCRQRQQNVSVASYASKHSPHSHPPLRFLEHTLGFYTYCSDV